MKLKKRINEEDILEEIREERESNRKVFRMKDGRRMMAISNEPIHFWNEETKQYEEISTELIEDTNGFCGKCGEYKVRLPDGKNNINTVRVKHGDSSIAWEYAGVNLTEHNNKRRSFTRHPRPYVDTVNSDIPHMEKGKSKRTLAQYSNVDDGIDFQYEVHSGSLKENIIIRQNREAYNFAFTMHLNELIPVLAEDNRTISFFKPGNEECTFKIPAPFMSDAKGEICEAIEYGLKETSKGEYLFTIKADAEWINASDRAMPVTVDPAVEYSATWSGAITYVNSNSSTAGITVGHDGTKSWTSTITAYISNVPEDVTINSATLYLRQKSFKGDSNFKWCVSGCSNFYGVDDIDYNIPVGDRVRFARILDLSTCEFDVSPYSDTQTSGNSGNAECCDDDSVSDNPMGSLIFESSTACIEVEYSDPEMYTFFQPELNHSSVNESVNLFTGELLYNHDDITTGSAAFPVTVSHRHVMKDRDEDSVFGKGWKLSLDQSVKYNPDSSLVAEYIDGNSKKHYFTSGGTDTGGLGLKFIEVVNGYDITGYEITDRSGGKLSFDADGVLCSISDANGNYATITRNSDGNITRVRDNFGRTITMTYNSTSGKLEKMTDPSEREVRYSYLGERLVTIINPDNTKVRFTYDTDNRIFQATQLDGTKTVYRYSSSSAAFPDRVIRVEQYASDKEPGTGAPEEYRNITYRSASTTEVSDRSGISKVYAFDEYGRTILEYELDLPDGSGCDDDCNPLANPYATTGTVVYQYNDNKRTFASSLRSAKDSDNFVVNGKFSDEEDTSWVFVGNKEYTEGIRNNKYRINGNNLDKYIKQTIPAEDINIEYGDTLILSAWAMADSESTGTFEDGPKFEIRAEAHYTDSTTEEVNALFDCDYTEWQYAALPIRVNKDKTLDYITVYLDYSNNRNICWFSNVRLVNAPAQSAKYEKDPGITRTIFGTSQTIKERVTTHDGIYTVVDEKNENYDVVRRTITDMNGSSFVSVFKYDDKHRLIRTQNYRDIITDYTYNSVGMQTSVKSYYYDDFNRSNIPEPTHYFYQETTYDSTGEFATEVGDNRSEDIKTTNTYNKTCGLLLGTTSPNGQSTTYQYEDSNDLVTKVSSIVDGNEYSVLYSYDSARRLSSITHNGFDYDFTYDGMGRTKTVSIADTVYTTNDYTLSDTTTVSTTYAGGEKMTVETDRHQQPVKRTYTNKNGVNTVMATGEYDSLGKPTKVIDKVTNKVYTYTYDTYENVTAERVNGETFKSYEYDNHGRLEKTTISVGDGTQVYKPIYDKRSSSVIYADNTVVGVELEGVFTANSAHDDLGRVTSKALTLTGATNPLISEEISYLTVTSGDKFRLTNIVGEFTNKVNGTTTDALTYIYDNNGNITEVKRDDEVIIQYAYDGLNQLVREDNAILGKIYTFTYDTAGNITQKKIIDRTALGIGVLAPEQTIPYTYATTGWKDRLTSYNGETITYDALGNPTTYRGHNLTWGKIKQLEAFDSNTFAYNASGIRIRKNNITYELDGTKILREVRSTGAIEYYYGTNGVAGFKYNNADYYYQKNLQGDITAIYNVSGTKVAEYIYDAWGNCTVTLDTNGIGTLNPFRYRSYYYDTETGLYYLQTRYYDPEIGRFINADDLVSTGQGLLGHNMFAYCGNNPINRKDPTGQFWITAFIVTAVAVVCTVALSGCSAQPTSDVGAASPYSPSNSTDYNCYAYALGEKSWKYVGGSPDAVKDFDVNSVAEMVLLDAKKDGRSMRIIDSYDSPIESNEYRIALRTGKEDYHFMVQHNDGSWSHKPGLCSTRLIDGANPSVISWDAPQVDTFLLCYFGIVKEIGFVPNYYDSRTIYFAVSE